ncbi:5-hydroxytryptamine (serotonin) receptor 3A [Cricetulus griseus]
MLLCVPQVLLAPLLSMLLAQAEDSKLGQENQGSSSYVKLFSFPASQRAATQAHDTTRPALLRLSDHLLANYRKGVRPVRDWRNPTTVSIDVIMYAILSVDEKNQVLTTYIWYRQFWTDEFLQWTPEDFDNITKLSIPTDSIWVPDILINEFVDVGKSPNIPYVYVHHRGEVQNYKPLQVVTACSLDIYNFPFDVQNCSLTFTSWLHSIQDINISLWRSPEEVRSAKSVFMNQGEWELLGVLTQFQEFSMETSYSYAEMKFYERGKLRRDSSAPGPPRLSVGAAVAPELAVRSRPRTVGSRALHLMRSGCLSHPGAPAASLPSPSHAPARARNAHDSASLWTHRNAQTRSAATSSPPPRHAPSVSNSGTPAAGAGGRRPC